MPLKVSHGIGAWIKDFKGSDAPQFKGKSDKERRDQAIAAYLWPSVLRKRGKKILLSKVRIRKLVLSLLRFQVNSVSALLLPNILLRWA